MAKIRDYTVTEFTATSSTFTPDTMPVHQTGDVLVAIWGKDSTTGLSTSTGWTEYIDQSSSQANGGIQMKRAASASETFSATLAAETGVLFVMSVMDCFGSTLADAIDITPVVQGADDSTIPYSGVTGESTTNNECILIYSRFSDAGTSPTAYPPAVNLYNGDAGNGSIGVAYSWKQTAGSIAEQQWYGRANDDGRAMLFALRSSGSGAKAGYSDPAVSIGSVIRPLVGLSTMQSDTWPTSLSITTIGGITLTYDAAGASVDNGTNPYTDGTNLVQPSSTTVMYAAQLNFGAAEDMDTGIILTAYRPALVRDLSIDPGLPTLAGGGYQLTLRDASNNYLSYIIHAKGTNLTATNTGYIPVAIDWNGTATSWASSGTIDKSAVASILMGSRGRYGAVTHARSMLCLVTKIGIAGGSSTVPLGFDDLDDILNYSLGVFPLFVRSGSAATLFAPLQFGGSDPIQIEVNLRTFQFPTRYDGTDNFQWNAADNVAGVKFYGVDASDSLSFTNCVFTSEDVYRFEFDASHSANSTINFNGTSIVNATVTLQSTSSLSGTTFINCPTFTHNGASLDNCTFSNTKIISSSPANAALISNSSFTSTGSGHAIEISGTAANFTLTENNFTGYASSDGSTGNEAIYINIASGTITISISGGDTPSIRSAGATVTVENAVTLEVNNPSAAFIGARVTVSANAGGPESEGAALMLEEAINDGGIYRATQSYNFISNQPVTIKARLSGFLPFETTGTITANGLTVTAIWLVDTIVN